MDIISYILSKKYTDKSLVGAGALKGANCTIQSIEPISGGHRITFKWILNDDTVETDTMDVMDGNDGLGIKSIDINSNNHLIVTYDDNTTHDAGLIEGDGSTVTYTQTLQSGTKIGEITIDGTPTNIYAPSGGGGGGSTVVVTPLLSTGTKIAEIDVDGDTTNLFAPNSAEEKKCVISIVDDDGTNRTSDYYTGILSYLNGKGIPLTLAVPVDAPSKSSGTYNLTQLHDIVNAGNEVVMHGQTSTDTTRTQTLAEFQTCVDSSVTWAETNNFTSNIYVYPGGTQPNLDSAFNDKLAYLKNNSIRAAYNVNTSVENHETTGFEDWYTYMNGVDYNGVSNRIPFVTMPNGNNKTLILRNYK